MKCIKLLLAITLTMFAMISLVYGQDTTLTVTSSGLVGIGTASPGSKLHVQGTGTTTIDLRTSGTTNSVFHRFFHSANIQGAAVGFDTGDNVLKLVHGGNFNTSTKGLTIASEGDVGIGTTSPMANLHVFGDSGNKPHLLLEESQAGDFARLRMKNISSGEFWDIAAGGSNELFTFWRSGTGFVMALSAGGNVGIGTTTPAELLHVSGSGNTKIVVDAPGASQSQFSVFKDGSEEWTIYTPANSNDLRIHETGPGLGDRVTFQAGGFVGIGTTNPKGALDVNGSILQRGGTLHADYVFEPDYQLESVEEHAKFMWKNKHLKAIPKAQVDENGQEVVEVGAHRKGIVEELEKSHIYIEQLLKRIKVMEGRLAKLEDTAQ